MKPYLLAALAVTLPWMGSQAQANTLTPIKLKTEQSVPHCTFDRTFAQSTRIASHTLAGQFTIQCQPQATPYLINTPLSPFARLRLDDGNGYSIVWFMRHGGPACDGKLPHPEATPLHTGNYDLRLFGDQTMQRWHYCVQLLPIDHDTLTEQTPWPLQGALSLTLSDPRIGPVLPKNAIRQQAYFDNDDHRLTPQALDALHSTVMNLGDPKQYHVQLHAHTSLVGEEDYNHGLSLMRLHHVRELLIQRHGIHRQDTWGQAWGEHRLTALNTPDGDEAARNRRVDIIFLPKADYRPVIQVHPAKPASKFK